MKIEHAIYGEVHGGHALRLASGQSLIPAELASRLDLPDTAPPGVNWSPFVSGFPYGDRYVLARTFADSTATRAGMVLSHAVIAPLLELTAVRDLRPLLALLITAPVAPTAMETHDLSTLTAPPPTAIDLVPAAEALTTRGSGPVVRIGTQAFEDLAIALWFNLWPEIRARFAFRLSFGPHDLVDVPKPLLVCTPAPLAARWTNYRIVGPAGSAPLSRAAAILTGGAEANSVLRFASDIGAVLRDLADLTLLDRAYELASASNPTFEECVAVLRLVERLSPDPGAGVAGKVILIDRLNTQLLTATVQDVLLLRNLSTAGFETANKVWASLTSWAANSKLEPEDDLTLLSAIEDALSTSKAIQPWCEAILTGMAAAWNSTSNAFPAAFWRWADIRPAIITALAERFLRTPELEARLANASPKHVSPAAGNAVMGIARSRKWLQLHGAAAGASLSPENAVRVQFSVDANPDYLDGIRAALGRATPSQALEIALEGKDLRILQIVAEEISREPQLFKELDFSLAAAQEIWVRAIAINAEAWRGPADPGLAFTVVIQNMLDGGPANERLIAALSMTPVADLSDYSRRAEVWPHMAEPIRANLLKATGAGWIKRALLADIPYPPDHELESAILASSRMDNLTSDIATTVRIVSALPRFDQSRFLRWLSQCALAQSKIAITDAEILGNLALDRRWQRAVDEFVRFARAGRDDFKPAVRICQQMLNFYTRWSLGLAAHHDKWAVLEELSSELYPTGPDHNELWARAGGSHSDLQSYGTGRSRWRNAITQVKNGKVPQAIRLLDEMKRDFPANDSLRRLALDPEFKRDHK